MSNYTLRPKKSGCRKIAILPEALAIRLQGWHLGVDEAGRGCLAGPVTAGAVLAPPGFNPALYRDLAGLTDSKQLSATRRNELAAAIKHSGLVWAIGHARPAEIDEVNILNATFRAMSRAVLAALETALRRAPKDFAGISENIPLLIDGQHAIPLPQWQMAKSRPLFPCPPRQFPVIKGDALIPAISAASIMAKTARDALMLAMHRRYPLYGFDCHKGYGTALHMQNLSAHGPCPLHRLSFGKDNKEIEMQQRLF